MAPRSRTPLAELRQTKRVELVVTPVSSPRKSSQRRLPEPQRIANDGDRAERHGRTRDHWAEQQTEPRVKDSCGNGNARYVVDKREEQILPNVPHRIKSFSTATPHYTHH